MSPIVSAIVKAILLLYVVSLAAQASDARPGAGSILQQINPSEPPAPSPDATGLSLPPQGDVPPATSEAFMISRIEVTGNVAVTTETLHELVKGSEGTEMTLAQLGELASRITAYYHARGFTLSRAIIPAQTIRDGVVRFEVIEARYGDVRLDNESPIPDLLLQSTLASQQPGRLISQSALDHDLLLMSDVPGIVTAATLKPGQAVGQSDLQISVRQGDSLIGNVVLDNDGNRYTGRVRTSGTVGFLNPFKHGDILSLSALTSNQDMQYGRVSYDSLLDGRGTRAGGAYSALHYELGDDLASLEGKGTADVGSLWLKHPLRRGRTLNVYTQIQFDYKRLNDAVNSFAVHTDRHLNNWTASLFGDNRDTFFNGAVNLGMITVTAGRVEFDNNDAELADDATAQSRGGFLKWTANVARLQRLTANDSLYLTFSGQWANANLDSAEQMVAGGAYTVRAYDIGVLSGDRGYQGTVELRHNLSRHQWGQWQTVAFYDHQHLTINQTPWTTGINDASLSGAGVGVNWAGPERWHVKLSTAKPVGSTPELLGDVGRKIRAWLQVSKQF